MKWFKHSGTASRDARLAKILTEFGLEGYGLYFYCLELIASKTDSDDLSFELEHDAALIASWTGSDTLKVEKIMRRCVELELFGISDNGHLTCFKLIKWIDRKLVGEKIYNEMIGKIGENPRKSPKIPSKYPAKAGENPLLLEETRRDLIDKKRKDSENVFNDNTQEDEVIQNHTPIKDESLIGPYARIEKHRAHWNSLSKIKYRFLPISMDFGDRSILLKMLPVYTDEEITEAINNYHDVLASAECDLRFRYESFPGFIDKGIPKFISSADPWTTYKKRKLETFADAEERQRQEILAEFGANTS